MFEDISVQNDPPIDVVKRPRLVSNVTKAVAETVGGHVRAGQLPLTIGGDHSLVRQLLWMAIVDSSGVTRHFSDRLWAQSREH